MRSTIKNLPLEIFKNPKRYDVLVQVLNDNNEFVNLQNVHHSNATDTSATDDQTIGQYYITSYADFDELIQHQLLPPLNLLNLDLEFKLANQPIRDFYTYSGDRGLPLKDNYATFTKCDEDYDEDQWSEYDEDE
jgi:hypothetical protein